MTSVGMSVENEYVTPFPDAGRHRRKHHVRMG